MATGNGSRRSGPARIAPVVLSDRTIRRLLDEGRIEIDPFDAALIQPSSVDVRADRHFRVFHNARYPYIDVKQPQEELTELVSVEGDSPFILHPGEFVLGTTLERVAAARTTSSRGSRARARSAASASSSTRRPASSTPAGTAR